MKKTRQILAAAGTVAIMTGILLLASPAAAATSTGFCTPLVVTWNWPTGNTHWIETVRIYGRYLWSWRCPLTPIPPATPPVPVQPAPAPQPSPAPAQPAPTPTPAPQPSPAPVQPAPTPTQPAPAPVPPAPTTPAPAPAGALTAEEQEMLALVNQARQQAGLNPLTVDPGLEKVARTKAQDMVANHYFSHTSPTYGSPFDMMRQFGVTYSTAGENLAGNQTVSAAFASLMNSPGHRANILNPNFTRVGIGIVSGSPYGEIFVQEFAG